MATASGLTVQEQKTPIDRRIRARILVNGSERKDAFMSQFTVNRTRYSQADTCSISFALDRQEMQNSGAKWFDPPAPDKGNQPDVTIEIQMRDEIDSNAVWESVFYGTISKVSWNPTQSALNVSCRDIIGKLMDTRVQSSWLNKKADEIMRLAISAAGLSYRVNVNGVMSGQYWQLEHKRQALTNHSRYQTAYDLVRFLADDFECDLYADRNIIVCEPRKKPTDDEAKVYSLLYHDNGADYPIEVNALNLTLERDYTISKNVMVHVISWDSRQRIKAETYFSADGHSKKLAENSGTLYPFRYPNLKQDQIERIAETKYRQIVAHNRVVRATIPGRFNLTPRTFMRLVHTGSSWDNDSNDAYAVDEVNTSFSATQGYTQSITLRNRLVSDRANNVADQ